MSVTAILDVIAEDQPDYHLIKSLVMPYLWPGLMHYPPMLVTMFFYDWNISRLEQDLDIHYNADFSGLLQDAKPDDVDLFGRMLLVTKFGIDETKAWFYSRGSSL
ncbi:Pc22g07180 [Penicillium rubens Wisconsin 54-1255]|jgi:hypothetical protein|uniref:Pc22g07180 protein n=1 Tax=Penicillium rubens (strain ATCC 28089 / DSM 1075 / NRRL 1951 / Wisconsin 54-1255) TaxID=500485 RepID=B6HQK5_PENRW|nr:uncharacterized protein N7525_005518 [Penicillium rubens]KAJ5840330.1 hypothetical protein N7525_005518 [Penicillium rubens]KAJ5868309.1 hypothetical protein N7534_002862 [Penicillium rubens]CAP98006.1 Pc22g07180 [Penicillium rubens Wisconsin 54-1255]